MDDREKGHEADRTVLEAYSFASHTAVDTGTLAL